ncbi:MAG: glycosyltransferase family 2 protein [Bacteroidia bacterium]|nr:glycosyltransferase family 2 protein [Bacteroidia bacterium]NND52892.1 glycosyltransferase family 2 protein [Flavobacteriaceae bacterium]
MKLSVVILNYNVRYFLELCLKSVEKAIEGIEAEIIVIDNNSADDSCAMVANLFPKVILIKNFENLGFSKANNQAVAHASGDYVCILNPDTVVAEDTFIRLLDYADSFDKFGSIGCRLIDGTGAYLPESKRNIPLISIALQKLIGNDKRYYANQLANEGKGKIDVLVGAFMLLKKEVYLEVGGFDEDYFMYGEDIDLSYRLLKKGYQNYYYGQTTIIHYKGESTLKDKKYAKRFYGAMQLFYKKHFSRNIIFDAMVWFGLKLAFLIRRSPKSKQKMASNTFLVSNMNLPSLQNDLNYELVSKPDFEAFQPHSEIILDANYLSYKDIIGMLSTVDKKKAFSFKIIPQRASFLIGSDDSINQGEIIHFTK